MDQKALQLALAAQRTEITEYHIYKKLAKSSGRPQNKEVLNQIADHEKQHAGFWEQKTGKTAKVNWWRFYRTIILARLLGLAFALKLMEKNEGTGARNYERLAKYFPEVDAFAAEEGEHEREILKMLEGGNLTFVGSVVLGLNDALVELTGALAGFTLALGDTRIISLAGLVTGISAALSMAASEFLSSKAEGHPQAKKSAIYTGLSYLITVILLILPFFLFESRFVALGVVLATALFIILAFNYYVSVVQDLNFRKRFLEMAVISMGVAAFSFFIGYGFRALLGVEI